MHLSNATLFKVLAFLEAHAGKPCPRNEVIDRHIERRSGTAACALNRLVKLELIKICWHPGHKRSIEVLAAGLSTGQGAGRQMKSGVESHDGEGDGPVYGFSNMPGLWQLSGDEDPFLYAHMNINPVVKKRV